MLVGRSAAASADMISNQVPLLASTSSKGTSLQGETCMLVSTSLTPHSLSDDSHCMRARWLNCCMIVGFMQQFAAIVDNQRPGQHIGEVLKKLSGGRRPTRILCTGHSLGGALATLGRHPTPPPPRPFCTPTTPPIVRPITTSGA